MEEEYFKIISMTEKKKHKEMSWRELGRKVGKRLERLEIDEAKEIMKDMEKGAKIVMDEMIRLKIINNEKDWIKFCLSRGICPKCLKGIFTKAGLKKNKQRTLF